MVLNIHCAIPTPMPYYIQNSEREYGDALRDLRTARSHLKFCKKWGKLEYKIIHVKRNGTVEVVE